MGRQKPNKPLRQPVCRGCTRERGNGMEPTDSRRQFGRRIWLLITVIAVAGLVYWQFGNYLRLEYLAERESDLRTLQSQSPVLVWSAAFLIYVLVTGLSLPGALFMTLVMGWYFGFWYGLLLVSFASTAGATMAFLFSRYLFRNAVQRRFGDRLRTFHDSLEREGALYLFTLRLIPVVPFFVINAVMGLTPIRPWTFWWVSQLGMLAGTAVYMYAGSRVPDLKTLSDQGVQAVFTPTQLTQITLALLLLGLFPLVTRKLLQWLRPSVMMLPSAPDEHAAR